MISRKKYNTIQYNTIQYYSELVLKALIIAALMWLISYEAFNVVKCVAYTKTATKMHCHFLQ
jgi:hypothetical protein